MSNKTVSLDILWGVDAIAAAIGRSTRATYHLLENGHISVAKKVGGRWCATRRGLCELFDTVAA